VAVNVRTKAAEVRREPLGDHRLDAARDVYGERALGRVVVERRARRDEAGNIGNMNPGSELVPFRPKAESVVEVLGLLRVDREGDQVADVYSLGLDTLRFFRKRRGLAAHAFMPKKAF
jgi:hypothetical protein